MCRVVPYLPEITKSDPFRYFKTSREIIRLAFMVCVRFTVFVETGSNSSDTTSLWVRCSHSTVFFRWPVRYVKQPLPVGNSKFWSLMSASSSTGRSLQSQRMSQLWTKPPFARAAIADAAFLRMCSGTHFAAQRFSSERPLKESKSAILKLAFRGARGQQSGHGRSGQTTNVRRAPPKGCSPRVGCD